MAKIKYKMTDYNACSARIRPSYCKFTTNVCCFGCEYNLICLQYAKNEGIKILPCGPYVFEEQEVCEFAI